MSKPRGKVPRGPCHYFQRTGRCRRQDCPFAHDANPSNGTETPTSKSTERAPKAPCHFFQRTGRCGKQDCPYLHDPNMPKIVEDPNNAESLYHGWVRLLGSKTFHNNLKSDQMEKFLSDALRIFELGSSETIQQVIRELGDDRGLRRITQIVESTFGHTYSLHNLTFKTHCIPFLRIISHDEMRSSLVLERAVGTIYNIIYGPGGQRGIRFFKQVADYLSSVSGTEETDFFETALFAVTSAFFNTLNLNQSAGVQETFKDVVNTLNNCISNTESNNAYNFTYRFIHDELVRIKILLKMADEVPGSASALNSKSIPKHQYRMQIDGPGDKSQEGPRHDNDHSDISLIKILPTSDEIRSHRSEFLPQRSPDTPHHLEGISRVLDFQFRLLREDTSGQLREAVRIVQDSWAEVNEMDDMRGKGKVRKSNVHTIIYTNVRIEYVKVNFKDGLVLNASFDQPRKVRNLSDKARAEWWEKSRYLAAGSLLCLVDSARRSTFLVISGRVVKAKGFRQSWDIPQSNAPETGILDLAGDQHRAMVSLRFAGAISESDIQNIFKTVAGSETSAQVLVEFPGLLFASFNPILRSLQQVIKTVEFPFSRWIAPSPTIQYSPGPSPEYIDVPPPLYMTKPGIVLDLKSISGGNPLTFSVNQRLPIEDLKRTTSLDNGQCEALLACLSRELALIQGPPGTGKSYLGVQIVKVLLDNREKTKIGPIICVCYTNHALDQFLEHLLKEGATKIIRIGSRSKSEALEPLSLQMVAQKFPRTKMEKYEIAKGRTSLEEVEKEMAGVCSVLPNLNSPTALKEHLKENHPEAFLALFGNEPDGEGFKKAKKKGRGRHNDDYRSIDDWIQGREVRFTNTPLPDTNSPIDYLVKADVWGMSRVERMRIKEYWVEEMREQASIQLLQGSESHAAFRAALNTQYRESERRCLQDCHVIGVTTTGFAGHAETLRSLNAKVLICEEAAEVLESHTLTALLPKVEHAILIGDHLQLRPQIMNHDFSMENPRGGELYGLDTSFFERIAENERYDGKKFPVAKLDTQRRMHPSIASLIRNTLYPDLIDHSSTEKLPEVIGMARRLFWMDHRVLEAGADKMELIQTSHANEFEADMVVGLVRHLSRQGFYKRGEIAVITPYLRQLHVLRKKLGAMFEVVVGDKDQEQLDLEEEGGEGFEASPRLPVGPMQALNKGTLLNEVRVATVDNFQGEEAKIVVISLVRSNLDKKCGFLKTPNRINVLLSRAQHGMYIFGNAETSGGKKMWADVIKIFDKGSNIDTKLELRCTQHPETSIFVKEPEDFNLLSPEGGCNERCQWRLNCGHPCVKKCHSDMLHRSTVCMAPCERSFGSCEHSCPNPCGLPCGNCKVRVPGMRLACGHISATLFCYQLQELSKVQCQKTVSRKLDVCGHEVEMKCWMNPNVYKCAKPCGSPLPCGHSCIESCRNCRKTVERDGKTLVTINHGQCKSLCGRGYTGCKHTCTETCHTGNPCKPCSKPCEVRCEHSRCGKQCCEPCAPCAEQCSWTCKHREPCKMPCAVPCDIIPCSKRCDRNLPCGHQCPSVCGEKCPSTDFCQVCGKESNLEKEVDFIMGQKYSEIDLDEEPVIVPSCGHFYTMDTYDHLMNLKIAYKIDDLGNILGPKALDGSDDPPPEGDEPPEKLKMKVCPDCRTPLRDLHRYNRIVKVAYLEEATMRFCTSSQAFYVQIYGAVSDFENLSTANRNDFLTKFKGLLNKTSQHFKTRKRTIEDRLTKSEALDRKIQKFIEMVREEEQPYCKVREMVIRAQRVRNAATTFVVDNSAVQLGFRLKGQILLFQLKWASLWDIHTICKNGDLEAPLLQLVRKMINRDLLRFYKQCLPVIEQCQEAVLSKYEVEARIYRVQFYALYRIETLGQPKEQDTKGPAPPEIESENDLKSELASLDRCDSLCEEFPGTVGPLKKQVDKARVLLNGGKFYAVVTPEERMAVIAAMRAEFSGSGHWYRCRNGHPFTIGNCGGAVTQSTCPECGAPVGGQGYQLAEGVARADDFEQDFGRLNLNH